MGIRISQATALPSIILDRVHITHFDIQQEKYDSEPDTPKYKVTIYYTTYGLVDGKRYYSKEPDRVIIVNDYMAEALVEAGKGNMSYIQSLQSMESVIAQMLMKQLGTTAEVI